jgi:signal peptidase I
MSTLTDPALDETATRLRALAAAAAPTAAARPDLARVVLDRAARARPVPRWLVTAGAVAVAAAVTAGMLAGRSPYFTVIEPSSAMQPSIMVGEGVVFDRSLVPARGDVVLVRLEADGRPYDSILRVVGLAGDRVGCPEVEPGRCVAVVVNGSAVPEPFLPAGATAPFPMSTVPAAALFLLGDNRAAAVDSRLFGPVPATRVAGVGIEVVGLDGTTRAIAGAPERRRPADGDNVDPPGGVPPAREAPGGR